jgi:hypothetical protein
VKCLNMANWRGGLAMLCVCLSVSSCGLLTRSMGSSGGGAEEPAAEEAEQAASIQLVGEVASVHLDEGFVLIRRYGGGRLPQGFEFYTRSPTGDTASLRPTGEQMGRFYAADIAGGVPKAGDVVIGRRLPEGSEAPSVPTQAPKKQGFNFP